MEILDFAIGVLGGGGVTTIVTTLINKSRNRGQKMSDNDAHLKQLSTIMTDTINSVQEINKGVIANLKSELQQSQELTKLSHQREDSLIELINKGREYQEVLELKNKHKSKIIQKARKCDLLQGKSLDDCVVLTAYDEYAECKEQCKLNKTEKV